MSSRNNTLRFVSTDQLYHIGIRCLAATACKEYIDQKVLYHIGIRCLAATYRRSGSIDLGIISHWN